MTHKKPQIGWFLLLWLAATVGFAQEEVSPQIGPAADDPFQFLAWADLLYLDREAPHDTFFDVSHVYVNLSARFHTQWRAFLELEYEHEPGWEGQPAEREVQIDRAFIEYQRSAEVRFRLGKVNTPAGIWKPLHWAIAGDTVALPVMEDNDYIPTKSHGLEFSGTRTLKRGSLSYTLISGIVKDDRPGRETIDHARAYGGDLFFLTPGGTKVGLSAYHYANRHQGFKGATGLLPYLEVHFPDQWIWRTEYLALRREDAESPDSFYTQLKYRFHPRAYANARYDLSDDERRGLGQKRTSVTYTLGFIPRTPWRFKLETTHSHFHQDDERAFREWAFWVGYFWK